MKRSVAIAVLFVGTASLGVVGCGRLLGLRDDEAPGAFEHRAHTLEGVSCVECHAGMDRAGDEGELHIPGTARCVECHEDPHNPAECGRCHGSLDTLRRAAANKHHIRFEHAPHLEETRGQCIPCHAGASHEGETANAPMGVCLTCHEHEDQIRTRECDSCHVDLREEMPRPESHLVHGPDVLRTHAIQASSDELCTQCHSERFCDQCHGATTPALPSRIRFDQPMARTMHRAAFVSRHASEARADPGLCTTCHARPFCNDCHLDNDVSPRSATPRNPHPPGWVGALGSQNAHGPAARRDPASCASCHGGAGEMLCVSCHAVGGIGGNPHPPGFDSNKRMSELPCRLCHTPGM